MELHHMYRPITATPLKNGDSYLELDPCDALKPYIRCFWGTRRAIRQEKCDVTIRDIVTPDTCMDIIFNVDFTNNRLGNRFCGIDDRTFATECIRDESKTIFSFAIRFYAWGVIAFSEESVRGTKNAFFDVGYHFSKIKREIEGMLFDVADIYQLVPAVEKVLLKYLNDGHENRTVLRAVHKILASRGNVSMADLRREVLIGDRQLERLFGEYVGVSPKSLASLVRYQCLWSDIIYKRDFNVLDAVYQYGYSDQAHLCHDFKKYHSMGVRMPENMRCRMSEMYKTYIPDHSMMVL